jgi:hypothetical protein
MPLNNINNSVDQFIYIYKYHYHGNYHHQNNYDHNGQHSREHNDLSRICDERHTIQFGRSYCWWGCWHRCFVDRLCSGGLLRSSPKQRA